MKRIDQKKIKQLRIEAAAQGIDPNSIYQMTSEALLKKKLEEKDNLKKNANNL